ncbi:hypothetical protein [Streptomyces sp. GbtcB6]|uniref:hypothetical protein n=1 Tax=Streptomyces sp. GbtcB6 TaxID=2824751 RepID=UPI001C30F21C|nr:hypothetical protein [Streptomyces sp. GbtcB6]
MESLHDLIRRLTNSATLIDEVLSQKQVKLTPAAAEDLRASLHDIDDLLNNYVTQLLRRYASQLFAPAEVQHAVYPYRAERVVPLERGGFLAFADTEGTGLQLPQSGGDETGTASEVIPVSVYIGSNSESKISAVLESVQELVRALGYKEVGEPEVRRGSIFRRSRAVAQTGMDEVKSRLMKVERGFELAQLELRQAEVNLKETQAVSHLLTALEGTERACIQVGSVFVIKYVVEGRQVVVVRNLTQLEMHALTRFPEIQTRPEEALRMLATAIASMPEPDENGGGDPLPQGAS